MRTIATTLESLKLKFTSGNSVPVTRAVITLEEYNDIVQHINTLEEQNYELIERVNCS